MVTVTLSKRTWLPLIATLIIISGCTKGEITTVPKDAIVLDVRTAAEFEGWHFPGSINIPVSEIEERSNELGDHDQPIIVYCLSGHRSVSAKKKLIKLGFTDVKDGGSKSHMKDLAN